MSSPNQETGNENYIEAKKAPFWRRIKELIGTKGYYVLVSVVDKQAINSIFDDLIIDHEIWDVFRARNEFGLEKIPSGKIAFVFNISEKKMEQLKQDLSQRFPNQTFVFHPRT